MKSNVTSKVALHREIDSLSTQKTIDNRRRISVHWDQKRSMQKNFKRMN